jgi:dolichol-phosphate mannosyltransferase
MNTTSPAIDLSVVVPAHNEQENIPELYKSLKPILTGLAQAWEIIFVDDGSPDGTWDVIKGLNASEKGR